MKEPYSITVGTWYIDGERKTRGEIVYLTADEAGKHGTKVARHYPQPEPEPEEKPKRRGRPRKAEASDDEG